MSSFGEDSVFQRTGVLLVGDAVQLGQLVKPATVKSEEKILVLVLRCICHPIRACQIFEAGRLSNVLPAFENKAGSEHAPRLIDPFDGTDERLTQHRVVQRIIGFPEHRCYLVKISGNDAVVLRNTVQVFTDRVKRVRHCSRFGGINRLVLGDCVTALGQMAVEVLKLEDWDRLAIKLDLFSH